MSNLNVLIESISEVSQMAGVLKSAGVTSSDVNLQDRYTQEFVAAMNQLGDSANDSGESGGDNAAASAKKTLERDGKDLGLDPAEQYALAGTSDAEDPDVEDDIDNQETAESRAFKEEESAKSAEDQAEFEKQRKQNAEEQEFLASVERNVHIHQILFNMSEREQHGKDVPLKTELGQMSPETANEATKGRGAVAPSLPA